MLENWKLYELGDLLQYEQPSKYIVSNTEYETNGTPVLTAGKSFILGYTKETKGIYDNLPVILFDDFLTINRYIDFKFKVKSSAVKLLTLKNRDNNLKVISELMKMIGFKVSDHQRHWISQFSKLKINLPTVKEQAIIAEYLSNIDSLIENKAKLIEKKKLIKQGVMQELLTGKKRLPGFNKEWIKKELGELGEFTGGGVDKKSIPGQKKVTLLNFLDVYHRDFIYKKELYHNVTASDAQIRKCTLKKGDLFFTPSSELRTDLALSAVVMEDCPGCVYSYHITRFRFKDEFDLKFKSYVFNNKTFLDQAALAAEGSGKRYVVNLSKFKTLTIAYPTDIKEQAAIATILWDIDREINSLEQDLEKYKQIKQGMMEQLLTGKIRLVKESDNVQTLPEKKHNQHFDDAVVFANIVASCYDPSYPLGRKKCQKMMYLFKRFNECSVDQFKHYAAGPYDNKARYGGFETIAIKNKYVVENKSAKGSSFAPGPEIEKAKEYCSKYGYDEFIPIFNQYLKYKKVDELELYTTVDKTILELKEQGYPINLKTVKAYISNDKTWVPKLSREVFNDENIEEAIRFSQLVLGA